MRGWIGVVVALASGCGVHTAPTRPPAAIQPPGSIEYLTAALTPQVRELREGELPAFLVAHGSRSERLVILSMLAGAGLRPAGPEEWNAADVAAVDAACDEADADPDPRLPTASRYARAKADFQLVEPGGLRAWLADERLDADAQFLAMYWSGRKRGAVTRWPPEDVDAVLARMAPAGADLGPGALGLIWVIARSSEGEGWWRPTMPVAVRERFLSELAGEVAWRAQGGDTASREYAAAVARWDAWIGHLRADPETAQSRWLDRSILQRCASPPPPTDLPCP